MVLKSEQLRKKNFVLLVHNLPISVAARSKAWVCGHSLSWIARSNPAGGMQFCLF